MVISTYLGSNQIGAYKLGKDNNMPDKCYCCDDFVSNLLSYYRSHCRRTRTSNPPQKIYGSYVPVFNVVSSVDFTGHVTVFIGVVRQPILITDFCLKHVLEVISEFTQATEK